MTVLLTVLLVVVCLVCAIAFLFLELESEKDKGIKAEDEVSLNSRWSLVEQGPDSLYPLRKENEDPRKGR